MPAAGPVPARGDRRLGRQAIPCGPSAAGSPRPFHRAFGKTRNRRDRRRTLARAVGNPPSTAHRHPRGIGFFGHVATNGIRTGPAACYARKPFSVLVNRNLPRAGPAALRANRLTVDRFERAAMSQFCAATKTIVPIRKFPDFFADGGVYEGTAGSPRPNLASAVSGKTLVTNSEERLQAVLVTLSECKAALILSGDRDTAQLVSVAILELRIKLNRIEDSELKALCDAVLRDVEASENPKPHVGQRGSAPVLLKLVK
jgi:hypothetical protein